MTVFRENTKGFFAVDLIILFVESSYKIKYLFTIKFLYVAPILKEFEPSLESRDPNTGLV